MCLNKLAMSTVPELQEPFLRALLCGGQSGRGDFSDPLGVMIDALSTRIDWLGLHGTI